MAEKKKRLPQGWATIELGKLIARTQSVNPSITTENVYELWSVPAFPSDTPEYIQGKEIGSNKQVVKPGDVLLCKINPRINRVWLVREKIKADQIASTEWIVLRFKELFPRFIMYQLREEEFRNRLCSDLSGVGGSLTRARPRIVGKLEINIAPLNEQKRIVSKIEDLQSHSRRAKEALETIPDLLEQLRQSVLAAGVRGDLTKSWREKHAKNIEPASKLLERILTERRKIWEEAELAKMKAKGKSPKDDKWKKRYKDAELPKIEETYKIPETWVWTNIGQLSWSVKDGPHYSPKYSETGIPFISGGNVRPEGIDFSTAKYISPELHAQLSERCKPEFGDLLYTKGGTTGIARINTEKREFNVWVHVAVLKLVDSINPFYLQNALNSLYCYRQSQKYTHGVGNQDLGLTRMIWITVPLPPLQEQTEIIRRADEVSSIVSKIQQLTDLNLNQLRAFVNHPFK